MIKKMAYLLTATAVATLVGCGGGGSSSGATSQNAVIEGMWDGTSSSGYSQSAIALENGSTYVLFGVSSSSGSSILGFDQSDLTVSGSSISGTVWEYYNGGVSLAGTGTVTGTAVTGTSIKVTTTASSGSTITASFTPASANGYNYNAPASLASIAGTWTVATTTMSIDSGTGAITGSDRSCTFTGSVVPRASGKNVFDATLQLGSGCNPANKTTRGIAITYPVSGSNGSQLIMLVQDSTKQYGFPFISSR